MSKQLRDAIDVYRHAYAARMADWKTNEQQLANAAAVIEADRQATRAALVAEIVAWLREQQKNVEQAREDANEGDLEWRLLDEHASAIEQSADAIERKEWKR